MQIFDVAPGTRMAVGVQPISITIVSEPYLVATRRGYAPMVTVRISGGSADYCLLISSMSITTALEKRRAQNGGKLTGITMNIRKQSEEKTAQFLVDE